MMKWIGILAFLLVLNVNHLTAEKHHNKSISYRVTRSDYTFSTVFDMDTDHTHKGSVVKTPFHLTTHYDAYDHLGEYEGQGVCRLFCLGVFYTWATEIDVYNAQGNKVGFIDGQAVSAEPAKFSFYDMYGKRVAIGYLDKNCLGFSLVDPDHPNLVLASLKRNFILETLDNWDVIIYDPESLPPYLVKIFSAFVCDTQNSFKVDH